MKKTLLVLGGLLLLLVAAALLIPILFKDQLAAKARDEINKSLRARVTFGDFDLTILRSFPNISFCMNDLCITGIGDFEGDTLACIRELDVRMGLFDVIGGSPMKIRSVVLEQPFIHLLVLQDGRTNYDILKEDTSGADTASGTSFEIDLQSYALHDARIEYEDRSQDFRMKLLNVEHRGSGDFTSDFFTLRTQTTTESLDVWYGALKYLSHVQAELNADLDVDMKNFKYTFKENLLTLNELPLQFDGWVALPAEDIEMDLKWSVKKSDFRSFVSLLPGVYTSDFKELQSSGTLALNGFVKGTYSNNSIPAFELILLIEKGMFRYPALPSAVSNVAVDLKISNPDGVDDHTIIHLKQLHAELGKEPVDARLYVSTPVSDANMDGALKGTINLSNIKSIIPLEKGTDLSGIVSADVTMKGRYSSIERKQYEQFQAAGSLKVTDLNYATAGYPPLLLKEMLLAFNPSNVSLSQFSATMGQSDFQATGSIDNLLGYYLKDELLKGNFALNSTVLDLNELMTGTASGTSAPDTAALTVMAVPANIDFTLAVTAGKIFYDNLLIRDLKGMVTVRQQSINLRDLFFRMLNGTVTMNGQYATVNPVKPDFDFDLSLKDFDLQQTVSTFNTVKKLAPIAERCTGSYSADLDLSGMLSPHMQPVLNTLGGSGRFSSANVTVNNFEPVSRMADALKMEQYKKLEVKNVDLSFQFRNGRVNVKPFTTDLNGTTAVIAGSHGFDQTIDYGLDLSIPKSKIPASAMTAITGAIAQANKLTGSGFQLPDPVKVQVNIGGSVTDPVIKTDWNQQASSLVETVKEEIEKEIEEQLDAAKAEAKLQADQIMAEAEKQAQAIRDAAQSSADQLKKEGYAAADKAVAETKNPIAKAAAEQGAKKAKQEVDKKAQQLIDEGNKQAQKVIDDARKKSDEMLK